MELARNLELHSKAEKRVSCVAREKKARTEKMRLIEFGVGREGKSEEWLDGDDAPPSKRDFFFRYNARLRRLTYEFRFRYTDCFLGRIELPSGEKYSVLKNGLCAL